MEKAGSLKLVTLATRRLNPPANAAGPRTQIGRWADTLSSWVSISSISRWSLSAIT